MMFFRLVLEFKCVGGLGNFVIRAVLRKVVSGWIGHSRLYRWAHAQRFLEATSLKLGALKTILTSWLGFQRRWSIKSSVPECDVEFGEELPEPPTRRMRFKGAARTMLVPGETDAEVLPALRRLIPDGSLRSLCCTNRGEGPVSCEVLQEDLEADIPSDDSPSACIVKTCYADDIAKSEELAREWLEQKKFSPQQCLELLESVGLDFRANRRGGIHGHEERAQALAVGQYVRGHMCGVTNATKHRPMFVKYLVSFVREHNPEVAFSSVYLSCNTAVGVHKDRHNDYSCSTVCHLCSG